MWKKPGIYELITVIIVIPVGRKHHQCKYHAGDPEGYPLKDGIKLNFKIIAGKAEIPHRQKSKSEILDHIA